MRKLGIVLFCLLLMSGCSGIDKIQNLFNDENSLCDHYMYYYENISSFEKKQYRKLYEALKKQKEEVTLEGLAIHELKDMYYYVICDHPEMYWIGGQYTYEIYEDEKIKVNLEYRATLEEREILTAQLEDEKAKILANIDLSLSDVEKVKAVYDYVCENCKYKDSENEQTIRGVLLDQKAVCAGYARTIQYLLLDLGIDCTYVKGTTIDDPNATTGHAWNMVKIDDDYFYLDSTWGDEEENVVHTCYGYFLMSSQEMLADYVPSFFYEKTKDAEKSWFKMQGTYMEKWDRDLIVNLWKQAKEENKNYIEIKCSEEAFVDVYYRLDETQEMFSILDDAGLESVSTYYYVYNEELNFFDVYYN